MPQILTKLFLKTCNRKINLTANTISTKNQYHSYKTAKHEKNSRIATRNFETTMKIQKEYPELSKYLREMASNNSVTSHQRITALDLKNYHESLLAMVSEYSKTHEARHAKDAAANLKFSGYPIYPASEDIFNQGTTHLDIVSSRPEQSRRSGSAMNEKDLKKIDRVKI